MERNKKGKFVKGHSCSLKIRNKISKTKKGNSPAWNKNKPWSSEILQKITEANRKNMTGEVKQKISKTKKGNCPNGENHYNWIKDRSTLAKRQERHDSAYKEWVRLTKKRDNNICQLKDENCSGYNIVHHILGWTDYPELRYEVLNGITLCQFHHPIKEIDKENLISFFCKWIINQVNNSLNR